MNLRTLRYNGKLTRTVGSTGLSVQTLFPSMPPFQATEEVARELLNMNHTARGRGEFGPVKEGESLYFELFTDVTEEESKPKKKVGESGKGESSGGTQGDAVGG